METQTEISFSKVCFSVPGTLHSISVLESLCDFHTKEPDQNRTESVAWLWPGSCKSREWREVAMT